MTAKGRPGSPQPTPSDRRDSQRAGRRGRPRLAPATPAGTATRVRAAGSGGRAERGGARARAQSRRGAAGPGRFQPRPIFGERLSGLRHAAPGGRRPPPGAGRATARRRGWEARASGARGAGARGASAAHGPARPAWEAGAQGAGRCCHFSRPPALTRPPAGQRHARARGRGRGAWGALGAKSPRARVSRPWNGDRRELALGFPWSQQPFLCLFRGARGADRSALQTLAPSLVSGERRQQVVKLEPSVSGLRLLPFSLRVTEASASVARARRVSGTVGRAGSSLTPLTPGPHRGRSSC